MTKIDAEKFDDIENSTDIVKTVENEKFSVSENIDDFEKAEEKEKSSDSVKCIVEVKSFD